MSFPRVRNFRSSVLYSNNNINDENHKKQVLYNNIQATFEEFVNSMERNVTPFAQIEKIINHKISCMICYMFSD